MDLNHKTRISRYVEGLTLIQRLFAEGEVDFQGKHFTAEGLKLSMKPLQRNAPCDVVRRQCGEGGGAGGGSGGSNTRRQLGGVLASRQRVITKQAGVFHDRLDELGKTRPQEFPLLRNIVVAGIETALRDAGPFLEASYRIFGQWGLFTGPVGADKDNSLTSRS